VVTTPTWDDYPIPDYLPDPVIHDPSLPLVSVVTPSYNQGGFVRETIKSVLNQDYPNIEYWVIDGGSTDETLDILREFEHDLRFHWLSELDAGQSDAINKGFVRTHGSIWAWLNSDDVLLPKTIRTIVQHFQSHPDSDLVYGNVQAIDASGRTFGTIPGEPFDLRQKVTDLLAVHQPGQFLRRSIIQQIGPLRTDLHYTMDLDWWLRIALSGGGLTYLPVVLAQIRFHQDTKLVAASTRFTQEQFQLLDGFFSHPQLPAAYQSWRRLAYSNAEIYLGGRLLGAGHRPEARQHLWRGLLMKPWRLRSLLVILRLFDSYTDLNTWAFVTTIKRRLEHEKVPEWEKLLR